MNAYNFILEASSFEKGLGNIKKWCENTTNDVKLRLYIPTYTLRELGFQRAKAKSFSARESLKFIEDIEGRNSSKNRSKSLEVIIEFPDILDLIIWPEVLEFAGERNEDRFNNLPRRIKNLLKSCIYLCHLNETDDHNWILVTEDAEIRELASICKIPFISIVDADSELSKGMNNQVFKLSQNFNKKLVKNGITEETAQGKKVVKTNFDDTVYASRGSGILWTP